MLLSRAPALTASFMLLNIASLVCRPRQPLMYFWFSESAIVHSDYHHRCAGIVSCCRYHFVLGKMILLGVVVVGL